MKRYWSPLQEEKYRRAAETSIARVLEVESRRGTVVQAGGFRGEWARQLAKHFETVYTFEPWAQNFEALVHQLPRNVYPMRAVLGERHGCVLVEPKPEKPTLSGCQADFGRLGPVPTLRVDDLALEGLDALMLDVEGAEFPALKGAALTIARYRPLIVVEQNPTFSAKYGYAFEEIAGWLAERGYEPAQPLIYRDIYFRPRSSW